MTHRLFIDECLSPELVEAAIAAGFDATCSRDRGLLGLKDWDLVAVVIEEDFTLVTNNAKDFRGEGTENPGGLHARQEIHPGLICLNSCFGMGIERQLRLFGYALDELALRAELINHAMEIFEHEDGEIEIITYEIPRPEK